MRFITNIMGVDVYHGQATACSYRPGLSNPRNADMASVNYL